MAAPAYRFVSYDLDSSIEVATVLWANKGDGPASNNELAQLLDYSSANNGAFLTRLANARLFGMLEGPTTALRVSGLARRILHPEYPDDERAARLEAFERVPLFKAVLDRYHGQVLPSEQGMKNTLQTTFSINEDKSAFVRTRLMDSAEQAGLFQVAGDRTKMIRPTMSSGPSTVPAASPEVNRPQQHVKAVHDPSTPRSQKVIDGVLDMLPDKDDCTEDKLAQWLEFFESALRIFYGLPKPPRARVGDGTKEDLP
jgi:hypothetical protein